MLRRCAVFCCCFSPFVYLVSSFCYWSRSIFSPANFTSALMRADVYHVGDDQLSCVAIFATLLHVYIMRTMMDIRIYPSYAIPAKMHCTLPACPSSLFIAFLQNAVALSVVRFRFLWLLGTDRFHCNAQTSLDKRLHAPGIQQWYSCALIITFYRRSGIEKCCGRCDRLYPQTACPCV